jgi:hypothetical protein
MISSTAAEVRGEQLVERKSPYARSAGPVSNYGTDLRDTRGRVVLSGGKLGFAGLAIALLAAYQLKKA